MTYETIKEVIIQKIQSTYDQGYNVAQTIRKMEEIDWEDKSRTPKWTKAAADESQEALDIL